MRSKESSSTRREEARNREIVANSVREKTGGRKKKKRGGKWKESDPGEWEKTPKKSRAPVRREGDPRGPSISCGDSVKDRTPG